LALFFAGFGQGAHLVGHHRKALAMLAGPGGLDGGVQGQQVGLVGDAAHGLHDVADVGGLSLEFGHHLHRLGLAAGRHADIAHRHTHLGVDATGQVTHALGLGFRNAHGLQLPADGC